MKRQFHDLAEKGRVLDGPLASHRGDRFGCFLLLCPASRRLVKALVSAGDAGDESMPNGTRWDHVSVSPEWTEKGTPTWEEMAWVKSLFFDPDECAVEYHPPASVYVNINPNVLHIWRPLDVVLPMPPIECV